MKNVHRVSTEQLGGMQPGVAIQKLNLRASSMCS